jgi:hypothetical protein
LLINDPVEPRPGEFHGPTARGNPLELADVTHANVLIHRHKVVFGEQERGVDLLIAERTSTHFQAGQIVFAPERLAASVPGQPR